MMRFDDEQQMPGRRPNQDALLAQLGGGGQGFPQPGTAANYNPAASHFDTSGMKPDQMAAFQQAQQAHRQRLQSGFDADVTHLAANNGKFAPGYQSAYSGMNMADVDPSGFGARSIMPGEAGSGGTMTRTGGAQATADGPSSIFQSANRSIGGYLQDAMNAKRNDIIGIGDEAGRKQMAQEYIRSLIPEIEARGGKVGDVRNEKIQIDGEWRDLLRDIEGEAAAQYIVPDEGGSAPMGGGGMMGMSAGMPNFLQQDPSSAIQGQLAQFMQRSPNLAALIQQLQGGQGV